jgi:hypothetical protein
MQRSRRILGLALVIAGTALNVQHLNDWMRYSSI